MKCSWFRFYPVPVGSQADELKWIGKQRLQGGACVQAKGSRLERAKADPQQGGAARRDREMLPGIGQGLGCLLQPKFWLSHVFSPVFFCFESRRVIWLAGTSGNLLEHQGNEAPGAPHVFDIRLADGVDKRLLLDADPVEMAEEHAEEQGDQAGPVGHRQAHSQHGQEGSAVGRMADKAIRAVLHHLLVHRHGDIAGKVASQRPDGIPTQGDAQENEDHARAERALSAARGSPLPGTTRRARNSRPGRPTAARSR